jgi:hypothetical protein
MSGTYVVISVIDGKTVSDYFDSDTGVFLGATYDHNDGSGTWFTADGQHGSWSPTTQYWEFGGALGLGFGVWGDSNGDFGFNWNAGLGAYAQIGEASSPDAAVNTVGTDGGNVALHVDPLPSWMHYDPNTGLSFDQMGVDVGAYYTSQDPYYQGTPEWTWQFLHAIDGSYVNMY